MASIHNVSFEHYRTGYTLGVHERQPRVSWRYEGEKPFQQQSYNVKIHEILPTGEEQEIFSENIISPQSQFVPWPYYKSLRSRQRVQVRIQGISADGASTPWSDAAILEIGLLNQTDWRAHRIANSRPKNTMKPQPEELFRRVFGIEGTIASARLYITAQGVYGAEINGSRVGDDFLAPGWTEYNDRLQYQTYDITEHLKAGSNCIGVRLAEGWYNGRLGFRGGRRNIWGERNALLAQLEIVLHDGTRETVVTDESWKVTTGPIQLAEIYDGEKYDARKEITNWSRASEGGDDVGSNWAMVEVLSHLPATTKLIAETGEPARRVETRKPSQLIKAPSGKVILDFGQNSVGYLRIKQVKGPAGHKITLTHAEVLENNELGTRPLRVCQAKDEYILRGSSTPEKWEPRFTFHGFRYAQIDNWPEGCDLMDSIEAVICHTDMRRIGDFECSDDLINKLYQNVVWSTRGNFLSVPTDCPQRDERLGWTGDLALFAPTAAFIYDCTGILKNWMQDVAVGQERRDGLPAMVVPDVLEGNPVFDMGIPCAIWHDVTILAPWAVYQATGDDQILQIQYDSMKKWLGKVKRYSESRTPNLWHPDVFQLGDWLDPEAPPDAPWKAQTDSKLVADAFLVHTLRLMASISRIIGKEKEGFMFEKDFNSAHEQFQAEWVTPNGRMVCQSQTAYALAIYFDLLTSTQRKLAGEQLARIVQLNDFKIGTGLAGTPYICEALALTGHTQVAYAMLLNRTCPSWLYPITMGATTTWERWDSMLPDGSINPGEMTSFNHYAFGAVATFLHERIAGLKCIAPGWKKVRVEPLLGADFTWAKASHLTPFGEISVRWETKFTTKRFEIEVTVPNGVEAEIIIPDGKKVKSEVVGCGKWLFDTELEQDYNWPVEALSATPWRSTGEGIEAA